MSKYSLPLWVEVVSSNLLPSVIGECPWVAWVVQGGGLVLGADSSLADIINFICINAMPVHLIYHLVWLHAGQQGCGQVVLGEHRCSFP